MDIATIAALERLSHALTDAAEIAAAIQQRSPMTPTARALVNRAVQSTYAAAIAIDTAIWGDTYRPIGDSSQIH